jgi:anti-anti-sigma regulatory factor
VLRITSVADEPEGPCLKVEGRLVGEWVALLEGELLKAERQVSGLRLDLSLVDFANDAAMHVLRAAAARGVRVIACSPLLLRLLGNEEP